MKEKSKAIKQEWKMIKWPTAKKLAKAFVVVVVGLAVIAGMTALVDFGASNLIGLLW